mmetsp:Transcript_26900/g.55832  ORF Transcript_26900/g.55832 Transcript_26900/m.55832 type:complete len:244 (-) Transcript_26900:164-895(-)
MARGWPTYHSLRSLFVSRRHGGLHGSQPHRRREGRHQPIHAAPPRRPRRHPARPRPRAAPPRRHLRVEQRRAAHGGGPRLPPRLHLPLGRQPLPRRPRGGRADLPLRGAGPRRARTARRLPREEPAGEQPRRRPPRLHGVGPPGRVGPGVRGRGRVPPAVEPAAVGGGVAAAVARAGAELRAGPGQGAAGDARLGGGLPLPRHADGRHDGAVRRGERDGGRAAAAVGSPAGGVRGPVASTPRA